MYKTKDKETGRFSSLIDVNSESGRDSSLGEAQKLVVKSASQFQTDGFKRLPGPRQLETNAGKSEQELLRYASHFGQ